MRDRVYAVLDLLRPEHREGIIPDYSKKIEDVYTGTTLENLKNTKQLGLFSLLDLYTKDDKISQFRLPSWVPDFSSPVRRDRIPELYGIAGIEEETNYHRSGNRLETPIVVLGTIKSISTHISNTAGPSEIFAACRGWQSEYVSTTECIGGGTMLDSFVTLLLYGLRLNPSQLVYGTEETRIVVEVSDVKERYEVVLVNGIEDEDNKGYRLELEATLPGHAMLSTEEGYLGLTFVSALAGDLVSYVFRYNSLMILRPIFDKQDHCQVIGSCFIEGLMMGEGLLGPFPSGWTVTIGRITEGHMQSEDILVFRDAEGNSTQLDPRAGPISSGWDVIYGYQEQHDEDDSGEEDGSGEVAERRYMRFWKTDTDTLHWADPRLSSQAFRDRGVKVRKAFLV